MSREVNTVVLPTGHTAESSSDLEGSTTKFNEQTNYVTKGTIIQIFLACASVDLVALMDQTTLAASLYTIGNSFGSTKQVSWIASGYFITSTVGQLIYGRLSDIWSRKAVLLTGLCIFFLGSLASSLAQSVLQLTIFRAFTGIGGGGLITVAQLIVSDVVPLREEENGAVVAIANGIGPVIGGALSSRSAEAWRWIFRLNLPLTILTTLCVVFIMPLKKVQGDWRRKLKAVDFVGILLSFAGMIAIIHGLTWGGSDYPWKSTPVIATLATGAIICIAFVLWQWKGPEYPLVPLHIFKSRIVNGACLTMMINGWNFVMQIYYVPTFYQLVYGYSPTKSGALLLPITIIQTISSTASGLIVHWVGRYRECVLFGWLCWAGGLGLMSTINEHTGLDKQIGYSILIGIGVGNTMQPFIRNVGATLGLAICGSILNNVLAASISSLNLEDGALKDLLKNPHTYASSLPPSEAAQVRRVLIPANKKGFRIIFLLGASLAVLGFVLAFVLMPQISLSRPDDEKLKEEGPELTRRGGQK
ncbi:hypothetical protein NQ176_g3573 [Zarea fungicola]|uniref:Uncharacterized protein n=1 Tax=Zarea fungicola TaxID=93591 RepID=A0ACC1NK25_9HYPO|nr:hypothetical protein NQ176_g3573 [Lecanicillium fungicola]